MKKIHGVMLFILLAMTAFAQTEEKKNAIIEDAELAKQEFLKSDWQMKKHFSQAYGYVIFPNVDKGAAVVGGASGNGVDMKKVKW